MVEKKKVAEKTLNQRLKAKRLLKILKVERKKVSEKTENQCKWFKANKLFQISNPAVFKKNLYHWLKKKF